MDGLMGHYMAGAKTKFIAAHTTSSIFYVFFLSWKKKNQILTSPISLSTFTQIFRVNNDSQSL